MPGSEQRITANQSGTIHAEFTKNSKQYGYNGELWGNWAKMDECPSESFAYAFRVKIEKKQGRGDDTAANGIQLKCRKNSSNQEQNNKIISSAEGPWGTWRDWHECGDNQFLYAYQSRIEKYQGRGDDSALNGFRFACKKFGETEAEGEKMVKGEMEESGYWGEWTDKAVCQGKAFIAGIRTKVEPYQGKFRRDDTALNDAEFFCKNIKVSPTS